VLSGHLQLIAGEEATSELDVLDQPIDADSGAIHRHAHRLVLTRDPAGSKSRLKPAIRQQVDRGK